MSQPCPHLGLIISVTRHASATERDADAMHDDLLATLEANGLATVGSPRRAPEYVVARDGGQVTEADRALMSDWATSWAHVATVGVSVPIDLSDDT